MAGNNAKYSSVVLVEENSVLDISDSTFVDNFSYEKGGVLCGDYQKTVTRVTNSTFKNNASVQGGVFCAIYQSRVEVADSLIEENFAVGAAVVYAFNNGYFEFTNTTVASNSALSVKLAEVSDSAFPQVM